MRGWTTSDVKNLIKTFRSETFSYLPKKVSDQNVFIKFLKIFTSEVVHPRIFLTFYIRVCCEVWTVNLN